MALILLIDDEAELCATLAKVLQRAGHKVVTSPNGNEALKALRQALPDLVITDILMPDKDGLETIIQLHREFPDIRTIAISGGGKLDPSNYLSCATQLGAHRVFEKPFDFAELVAAVAELVGR